MVAFVWFLAIVHPLVLLEFPFVIERLGTVPTLKEATSLLWIHHLVVCFVI